MRFQREMACFEQMNLRPREIPLIYESAGGQERRIMPSPDGEKRRSVLAEVGLKRRVKRDVAAVVKDQIESWVSSAPGRAM